jgi:hypothetical protein
MHRRYVSLMLLVVLLVVAVPMFGAHAWGTYHWRRTSTAALNLPIHDNVNSTWDSYVSTANGDWNQSVIFQNTLLNNSPISQAKRCTSATGKIEVCNSTYGNNGWLGIAGISLSGGHIVKGYTKLNDTYFNTSTYNTYAWRMMVACQEIGHNFGLGHQNEIFTNINTGSCMDYTNDPTGTAGTNGTLANTHPNAHDYAMLESIYAHIDSASLPFDDVTADATRPRSVEEILYDAGQWGTPVGFDGNGRPNVFRLVVSPNHDDPGEIDGEGNVNLTHVLWAPVDPFENINHEKDPVVLEP